MPLRKLWPSACAQKSVGTKCYYLRQKKHKLLPQFHKISSALLPSYIKFYYFCFWFQRSYSPVQVLLLRPNQTNLSLPPCIPMYNFNYTLDKWTWIWKTAQEHFKKSLSLTAGSDTCIFKCHIKNATIIFSKSTMLKSFSLELHKWLEKHDSSKTRHLFLFARLFVILYSQFLEAYVTLKACISNYDQCNCNPGESKELQFSLK